MYMHRECFELVDIEIDGYDASLPRHDRQRLVVRLSWN